MYHIQICVVLCTSTIGRCGCICGSISSSPCCLQNFFFSSLPAPEIAVNYWKLSNKALMRDVILAIRHSFPLIHLSLQSYLVILVFMFMLRADEAHHRVVNHTLGDLNLNKQNPFGPGE